MKIKIFKNGMLRNYTYFFYNHASVVIFDPSFSFKQGYEFIKNNNLIIDKIVLTHNHFDHFYDLEKYLEIQENIPIFSNKIEKNWFKNSKNNCSYLVPRYKFEKDLKINYNILSENDILDVLNISFRVLETPGHSPGSLSFYNDDFLISGDLIFKNSFGRWDLPGSNLDDLKKSLLKITKIVSGNVEILPGHKDSDEKIILEKEKTRINNFIY